MGYTTEFEGSIWVRPAASQETVHALNKYCTTRHGGYIREDPGCPSFWCDFMISEDGLSLGWNGNEKSYSMETWLPILIKKFFIPAGHVLNGRLEARGEDPQDIWALVVQNNVVSVHQGSVVYRDEEDDE